MTLLDSSVVVTGRERRSFLALSRELARNFYWTLRRETPDSRTRDIRSRGIRHIVKLPFRLPVTFMRFSSRLRADPRPKLAIVLLERMGDIVAAEPLARLARARFPGVRICWITTPPYAVLPANFPAVDDVLVVHCMTEWMFLSRMKFFDTIWNLHCTEACCPHCGIRHMNPPGMPSLQTYYEFGNLLVVQCINAGLPRLTDAPVLTPPADAVAAVSALRLPVRFLVIHCTASDGTRDWPADKWQELVTRLQAADPSLHVIEIGLDPLVIRQDGARQRSLCGRLSMLETAEVIRRASLFIGIDSGPAHLANAVGTPGVIPLGAFGGFASYLPYSGGYATGALADIVRTDGPASEVSVAAVFDAALRRLGGREMKTT